MLNENNLVNQMEARKEAKESLINKYGIDAMNDLFLTLADKLGTKFLPITKGYITNDGLAGLLNVDNNTIKYWTKESQNPEIVNELKNYGYKVIKNKEFQEKFVKPSEINDSIKGTDSTFYELDVNQQVLENMEESSEINDSTKPTDSRFRELDVNKQVRENMEESSEINDSTEPNAVGFCELDVNQQICEIVEKTKSGVTYSNGSFEFFIQNRGVSLHTLDSAAILLMQMTDTDSAKVFRSILLEKLKEGFVYKEKFHDLLEEQTKNLYLLLEDGKLDEDSIVDSVDKMQENCYLSRRSTILRIINSFIDLSDKLAEKIRKLDRKLDATDLTKLNKKMIQSKLNKYNTARRSLLEFISDMSEMEREMVKNIMDKCGTIANINMTDVFKELYPEIQNYKGVKLNRFVKEKKELMVDYGLLYKENYISKKTGEVTNINYLPTKEYSFIGGANIGAFSRTGQTQTIKLSGYGKELLLYFFTYIIPNNIKNFTEEQFIDYLVEYKMEGINKYE